MKSACVSSSGPDGQIVPDIEETLPGRGIWVKAERAALEKAVAKNLFARAAKADVKADADLADRVERLLVRRMTGDLGLARKSGALVFGFDNVDARAFRAGAAGGSDRSFGRGRGRAPKTEECLF